MLGLFSWSDDLIHALSLSQLSDSTVRQACFAEDGLKIIAKNLPLQSRTSLDPMGLKDFNKLGHRFHQRCILQLCVLTQVLSALAAIPSSLHSRKDRHFQLLHKAFDDRVGRNIIPSLLSPFDSHESQTIYGFDDVTSTAARAIDFAAAGQNTIVAFCILPSNSQLIPLSSGLVFAVVFFGKNLRVMIDRSCRLGGWHEA